MDEGNSRVRIAQYSAHRAEILVGTVIVIAGVAFVAAVAASGGGALILVPLVFVAENPPGLPAAPPIAEATR